ncbi:hypothetical protein D3C80_1893880 [compost metagenome]
MKPDSVVSHEEAGHILSGFFNCRVALGGHPLRLERPKEALCWRVVPALPSAAHTLRYSVLKQLGLEALAGVLAALV